jgi:hypothetical protein
LGHHRAHFEAVYWRIWFCLCDLHSHLLDRQELSDLPVVAVFPSLVPSHYVPFVIRNCHRYELGYRTNSVDEPLKSYHQ